MSNKELYEAALGAINRLFSDRSVSQAEARRNLDALRDEITILIDALEEE
jgi:hypothetical protein